MMRRSPSHHRQLFVLLLGFLLGYQLHLLLSINFADINTHQFIANTKPDPLPGKSARVQRTEATFLHDNSNLPLAEQCTGDQKRKIYTQLGFSAGKLRFSGCQNAVWLDSFFEEEDDIGSDSFLGISVGCNKGNDAVRTARMGMMDPKYDGVAWKEALGPLESVCGQEDDNQVKLSFPKREGEMHCIEPMPANFRAIKYASEKLGLDKTRFVVSQAAISSANGVVEFPDGAAGKEDFGIDTCIKSAAKCVDVPMRTLENYVEQNVRSRGPVNVLQIDVEGFDFDVLFGAGSVLDRTYYLEFEYHSAGNWGSLHLQDAVKLLNGKGFTCYWASREFLWRITSCYFDLYDQWHGWSNVACVHRSQTTLAARMEGHFQSTLANPTLDEWCGHCRQGDGGPSCEQRLSYRMKTYQLSNATTVMQNIMKTGECIKPPLYAGFAASERRKAVP